MIDGRPVEGILRGSSISSIPPNAFQDYQNLVVLDLTNNAISTLDKDVFQPLTNLEVLKLSGNSLQNLPRKIFAGRSKMKTLSVADNSLKSLDSKIFEDLVALQSLNLSGNNFTRVPFKLFKNTKSIKDLKRKNKKSRDRRGNTKNKKPPSFGTHVENRSEDLGRLPWIGDFTPTRLGDQFSTTEQQLIDDGSASTAERPILNLGAGHEINDTPGNKFSSEKSEDSEDELIRERGNQSRGRPNANKGDSREDTSSDKAGRPNRKRPRPNIRFPLIKRLDLSGNSWVCDCVMAKLLVWYKVLYTEGVAKNANNTVCQSPTAVANQKWKDLQISKLTCDKSALVSCLDGLPSSIIFQSMHADGVGTRNLCDKKCAQEGYTHGLFQKDLLCYCGAPLLTCTCPSEELDEGSSLCSSKTYISGAFVVSFGLLLGPTLPTSSLDNAVLSADTQFGTEWDFGDNSNPVSTHGGSVRHNYILSGIYDVNVTLTLPNVQSNTTLSLHSKIVDPAVVRITAPEFSDAQKEVDVAAHVDSGTEVVVRWKRYDNSGKTILGKKCKASWKPHRVNACLKAISTTNKTDQESASQSCAEYKAKLLLISTPSEERAIIKLFSQELNTGQKYLLDAYKVDNATYAWRSNYKVAYFNVTMVEGGNVSDCVALGASGLLGMECSDVQGYICRAGQVNCIHGGQEWNESSCLLHLGMEIPLSYSDAKTKCQTINGYLAIIDSPEKDQFVRQNVLGSNEYSSLWFGLSDHTVANYFLWSDGVSVGSWQPWGTDMPEPSTDENKLCVFMQTNGSSTTWATDDCKTEMHFICEYSSGERVPQAQTYMSGTWQMTNDFHPATILTSVPSDNFQTSELIVLPGFWFQHAGRVQKYRFQAEDIPSDGAELCFQIYRPKCEGNYFLVPPGCDELQSPYATCTSSSVNCPSATDCSQGFQYCPLSKTCLPLSTPCSCVAGDPAITSNCVDPTYTSFGTAKTSSQLGGDSYRYTAAEPFYELISETCIYLSNGTSDGLFIVDGGNEEVQPNDILGVRFINGTRDMLCQVSGPGMVGEFWRQNIFSVGLSTLSNLQRVEVNRGLWMDNALCNIQAIYTKPVTIIPPLNLRHKSVHTAGKYTYSVCYKDPLSASCKVHEKSVNMQFKIRSLNLANPIAKFPKPTAGASRMAVVRSSTTVDLLWSINKGTDVYVNTTLSNSTKTFSKTCPDSLQASVSQCSKNYQYHAEKMYSGLPGTLSTVEIHAWNGISEMSLTTDILSEEAIVNLRLDSVRITEFKPVTLQTTIAAGSDVTYVWDFGDGETSNGNKEIVHEYPSPGVYTITVKASNYLSSETASKTLKIAQGANVRNIQIQAPNEVDVGDKFEVNIEMNLEKGSSVTVLFDCGNIQPNLIGGPEIHSSGTYKIKEYCRYTSGNSHTITVIVVDDLKWDGTTDIESLMGESWVLSEKRTVFAWTIITGLSISSNPKCQAINEEVEFTLLFSGGNSVKGLNITWFFGDRTEKTGSELSVTKHRYISSRTFLVEAEVGGVDSKGDTSHWQCIETPISGLALQPESDVLALDKGASVKSRYDVTVVTGSNLKYHWLYNGQASTKPPGNFFIVHRTPGTPKVVLNVSNSISSEQKETTVRVIERIEGLKIKSSGNYLQIFDEYDFSASIEAGSDVNYSWSVTAPGQNHQRSDSQQTGASWSSPGTYSIKVTATNPVSTMEAESPVIVQLPVTLSGVTGPTDGKINVALDVKAEVYNGTEVQYAWQVCQEGVCQDQAGSDQTLTYTPNKAGLYTFTILAFNKVSSTSASIDVTIWEKLADLKIVALSLVNIVWGKKGHDLRFRPELESGVGTVFNWAVSSYTQGTPTFWTGHEEIAEFKMDAEGRYLLILEVSNPTGEKLHKTLMFNIQEAIEELKVLAQLQDTANKGESLSFVASHSQGSVIQYSWDVLGTPSVVLPIATTSKSFGPLQFNNAEEYIIKLNARNKVSDVIVNFPVTIQEIDSKYNIKIYYESDPYVHQNIAVEMSVNGPSPLDGFPHEWYFYGSSPNDPAEMSNLVKPSRNFTQTGKFIVEARISEGSTEVVVRKQVFVQMKLPEVSLAQDDNILATGQKTTFHASLPISIPDLQYRWTVGEDEYIPTENGTLTVQLNHAGTIRIQVVAENEVSFSENHTYVVVQDRIRGVGLKNCCYFATNETKLEAEVEAGTNVTFKWLVYVSPSLSSQLVGSSVEVKNLTVSSYKLVLTAENLVSKLQETIIIYTQDTIQGLHFVKPPGQVFKGQTVEFQADVDKGTAITYQWYICPVTWAPECDNLESSSSTFTHTFKYSGTYMLSLSAFNNVSREYKIIALSSFEIRCEPMVLTHIGGIKRQEYRSRTMQLEAAVVVNCTRYPVNYRWKIYDSKNEEIPTNMNESPILSIPSLSLPTGNYKVCLTAEYLRTPVKITLVYQIEVRSSPLIAIITGGTWRELSVSDVISLDASMSKDLDVTPEDARDLLYQWNVKAKSGSDVVLGNSSNEEVLVIPPNTLEPNTTYIAELTVSKEGRAPETTTQTFYVTARKVPLISIVYVPLPGVIGVYNIYSPGRSVKVKGVCSNCQGPVSYKWRIRAKDGEYITINESTSTTGDTKSNFVIKQGVLNGRYGYDVELVVKNPQKFDEVGVSSLLLHPNEPPTGGTCWAPNENDTIIALEDQIEVVCDNWYDPDDPTNPPVTYEVYVEPMNADSPANGYRIYSGFKSSGSYFLAPFSKMEETIILKVIVGDRMGGKVLGLRTEVKVKVTTSGDESIMGYLRNGVQIKLPLIVLHKDSRELLQYCTTVIYVIWQAQERGTMNEEDKENQKTIIKLSIQSLDEVPIPERLEAIADLSYYYKFVMGITDELSVESLELIMKFVNIMVEKFSENASPENSIHDGVPENILSIAFGLIKNIENYGLSKATSTGRRRRSIKASMEKDAYNLPDKIAKACPKYLLVGEAPFQYKENEMSCYAQKITAPDITNYRQDGFNVDLPPSLLGFLEKDTVVSHTVTTLPKYRVPANPPLASKTVSVKFQYENGSDIKVENLDKSRQIRIVMPNREEKVSDPDTLFNQSRIFKRKESFQTRLSTNSSFLDDACGVNIEIRGSVIGLENETDYETKSNLSLKAYLGLDYVPNWYKFDKELEITYKKISAPNARHQDWTFFTLLCVGKDTKKPDNIYITVINENYLHDVKVTIRPYIVTCQYYDVGMGVWKQDGLLPTEDGNRTHSVCLVNHLTLFGGSSLVTPDDIDFSDLAELDLAENPVVVILVSVIAGIFIIVLFWARQADIQDLHNISIVPLCGRDGVYKYEVIVGTGRKRGAGTSAHVGIKIYGSEAKSGARHLARMAAFQRNSEDSFLIASDRPLGNIQKIHLWHDNTGKHPSWFVSRVVVRDLQSNKKFFFLANCWLSLTVEQGSLDKQIHAASPEELSNFGTVFSSETSRGFAERHLWLSVWDRPPRSRFTRVQRVVCCATLLYSFMCANVIWYGLINKPEREAQALGLISINWQDFVIGILASLIVFPVNFIIIQIFRFSTVKVNASDYGPKPGTAQTIEVDAMCDISQGGDSFIVFNDRRNSIQRLHRQGSSDSIMVHNKLHRTEPSALSARQLASNSSSSVSTRPTSSGSKRDKQIPVEGKKWWSNDTILKWPEKMPSDQRPESSQGRAGLLRKTPAMRSLRGPKLTEYHEELLSDDDTFLGSDRDTLVRENKKKMVRKTTSQTLSISESIAEVDEDEYLEGSNVIPLMNLNQTQPRERLDSWGTTASRFTLKKDPAPFNEDSLAPNNFNPRDEPKLDSDSGEVNQALLEIDSNINESDRMEPKLMNKKKLSGNQGTTPIVDIHRLEELENEHTKEILDETSDNNKSRLRKTRSKKRVSKRWAQIVIPPEYEQYTNDSYQIFDPEDEYDAMSLNQYNLVKIRGNSLSSNTTTSSRFHQLMPASLSMSSRYLLPHWCVYIAYTLCFVLSGFSVIVTILYGHAFGKDLALKWLLAFFISFIDSVFILEPLKVLALAVFVSMVTRGLQDEDEGIETRPLVEANEKIKDVRLKPLGGFALLQAREEGRKVQKMNRMLRHFCIYFFFYWISFSITYRAHNVNIYPVTEDFQRSYLTHSTSNGINFFNVQRTDDMWSWMKEVGLPALYQDENFGENNQRILLGEARLRQIRGQSVECHAAGSLTKLRAGHLLTRGCYGDPDWHEEMSHYDLGWQEASNDTAVWMYSTPSQALGEDYVGVVSRYTGGGYVQGLGPSLEDAELTIQSLVDSGWVDRSTRALFLEATLYTIPTNLHTTVRILVEFPVTGGVFMSHDVQTFKLLNYVPGQVTALMIFIACLSLIWLYMVVTIVFSLRRHSYHYFFAFWNWVTLIIAAVVIFVIAMYIHCKVVDTDTYARYTSDRKGFNSFFYSATCFRTWKAATGVLVFLATTWMVRLMRFIKPLSSYGKTISAASWRLVGCTFILIIFLLGFTHLGHLWYGAVVGAFRSSGAAFITVFGFIRRQTSGTLVAMQDASPALSGFFLFSFLATVMVMTMGLFMAVLNSTYKTIRLQNFYHTSLDMQDHEMIDFMIKRFKKYIGITKPKPAFRRVKFQGMPSISSRSSMSSKTGMSQSLLSSGSYDAFGLDALEEQNYLEELLERCIPTWNRMLQKLERVLWLDREVTRLERTIIERLGTTLSTRGTLGLKQVQSLSRAAQAVGKVIGKGGSICRRSNSESLVTDIRAKQIRDALNAELLEMEQKILADAEKPSLPRKTMSFTEGRRGSDKNIYSSGRFESRWQKLKNNVAEPKAGTSKENGQKDREKELVKDETTSDYPILHETKIKPTSARPPLQPKRFLPSAGPRRTAHEVGLDNRTRDSSSGFRRNGSATSSTASRTKETSPAIAGAHHETTKDAPREAQRAYGSKLPRKDIILPALKINRRPTSEQSERVKKTPTFPLPKCDS